jgi:hypothetical protein
MGYMWADPLAIWEIVYLTTLKIYKRDASMVFELG